MYVTVIDCSALDALAYFFDVVSREDLRISSEQGNPARLVQRRTGSNDAVVAVIKKMPSPLHNREFVNRLVCCLDVNSELLFTSVPAEEAIDYGMKTNTVRGVSRALMRLTPSGVSHCKVTYHMHLDAGGRIPTFVVNSKIPLALGAVGNLREEFQRDDEIDKLERDQLARVIKDEPQTYTAEEEVLINKVSVSLGMLEWELFEELESPDHLVKMGGFFIGEEAGIARASTIIDASDEDCATWGMCKMSRAQAKSKKALQGSLVKVNNHRSIYHTVRAIKIPGFAPREFLSKVVWKKQGHKLIVAYESTDNADFPPNPEFVKGETLAYWEYETLERTGQMHQTRVTLTQRVDLKGFIPKAFVNKGVVGSLMSLSATRKQFDKSLEVDGATRALNVEMIMGHVDVEYSEEENRKLAEGERHFADFQEMKAKSLLMASPLMTAKIAFNSGDRYAWGYGKTTVRARPEEVLAFLWDTMRRSAQREDDLEKSVEEQVNGHNMLVYNKKRTPKIISDRDFLGRVVWKKEGEGFVLVTSPEERGRRVQSSHSRVRRALSGKRSALSKSQEKRVVQGSYPSVMRIKRKNDKDTTLEYVIHPDAGGSLPSFIMNRYLGSNLGRLTEIQEFFQAPRGLEEWDADDARAVGEVMCIKINKAEKYPEKGENKQSARMRVLVNQFKGLKEVSDKYEFFEGMMARVVRNTLKPAGDVKSKLCILSLKEGETIGRGLATALATNLTAEAGVDEWVLRYKSLGELDRTESWFR